MDREPLRIESRQNQRLKDLVKLVEQRKARVQQQAFVVEGAFEIAQLVRAGLPVAELYVCDDERRGEREALVRQVRSASPQVKIFEVTASAFEKVSQRQGPDGLLAVAPLREQSLEALRLPEYPLLLVVEKVEKPGNLGALIRSAEAAGAHAIVCCDPVTDLYNPHVIRNSRGLVFHLPCVAASRDEVEVFLRQRGIGIVATTPDTPLAHWDCDLRRGVAIFAGAEHEGLSDYWLQRATHKVRIPMAGQADSLNVNVASALVLFEALRQRSGSTGGLHEPQQ